MTEQELETLFKMPIKNLHMACRNFKVWLSTINLAIKMGMVLERRNTLQEQGQAFKGYNAVSIKQ